MRTFSIYKNDIQTKLQVAQLCLKTLDLLPLLLKIENGSHMFLSF